MLVLGEQDAIAPQLGVQEVQAHLAEVLVLGEQVVEDAQRRLQIKVDNVFRSGLGLRKSTIHHQLKSETYVRHFLIERLRCEVEVIERNKVTLQQAGEQAEINPVRELGLQLSHLQ